METDIYRRREAHVQIMMTQNAGQQKKRVHAKPQDQEKQSCRRIEERVGSVRDMTEKGNKEKIMPVPTRKRDEGRATKQVGIVNRGGGSLHADRRDDGGSSQAFKVWYIVLG